MVVYIAYTLKNFVNEISWHCIPTYKEAENILGLIKIRKSLLLNYYS